LRTAGQRDEAAKRGGVHNMFHVVMLALLPRHGNVQCPLAVRPNAP